jgi:hypothetical protein
VYEALSYWCVRPEATVLYIIQYMILHIILYILYYRERERKREREIERDAELAVNALGAGAPSRLLTKLIYVNRLK